jgi:Nitrile hydratase, alpha chain
MTPRMNTGSVPKEWEDRTRVRRYARIIARAWSEPAFKERLFKEPESVLAEYQLVAPPGKKIVVVETEDQKGTKPDTFYFVLGNPPSKWKELETKALRVRENDDWSDSFPCAKCWNGCCD